MSRSLHAYYLDQMGIETWVMRNTRDAMSRQSVKLILLANPSNESGQYDPFSDRAGGLLTKMIKSIGLSPNDIDFLPMLTGTLPESLMDKIKHCSPKVILVMGGVELDHHYQGVPLIVTYHPRDLLMKPSHKKKAYQDLLLVRQLLV